MLGKESSMEWKCHLPTQTEIADSCDFPLILEKRRKDKEKKGSKDSQLGVYFTKKYFKIIKEEMRPAAAHLKKLGRHHSVNRMPV